MSVLLWLAIPLVALFVGIVWAYLVSRPPRPAAMQDSMESFSRFREALEKRPQAHQSRRRLRRAVAAGGKSVRGGAGVRSE